MTKKELESHKTNCAALKPPRQNGSVVYNRGGAKRKMIGSRSLTEQVLQLRQELDEHKSQIQQLTTQLSELQTRKSKKINTAINYRQRMTLFQIV